MNPRAADPSISIDGIIVDEDVSILFLLNCLPSFHISVILSSFAGQNGTDKCTKEAWETISTITWYRLCLHICKCQCCWHQKKTYIYHHQKYILQFQSTTKVHRLESRGWNIPLFAFNFCPFDQLPSKDIPSKPFLPIWSATYIFYFISDFF